MTTPVVELQSLEIRVEPGIDSFQSTLPVRQFSVGGRPKSWRKPKRYSPRPANASKTASSHPSRSLWPNGKRPWHKVRLQPQLEAIFPVFSVRIVGDVMTFGVFSATYFVGR
jgi:hypothetical protein